VARFRRWGSAALAPAALFAALSAAPAAVQGRWMPPQQLTGESAILPEVALGPSGEGIAAWTSRGADNGYGGGSISVAVRPPGAAFGAPQVLMPGPGFLGGLLMNAGGDATVFFNSARTLHASVRPALGAFGEPVEVGSPGWPAIDAAGNVTFMLQIPEYEPPDNLKHVADRLAAVTRSADGTLGPVREITRAERIHGASIGVEPDGDTTVAWRTDLPGDGVESQPYLATSGPGGEFSEPQALGPPTEDNQGAGGSRVVTSAAGTLVAWPAQPPNPYPDVPYKAVTHRLHASFRPAGGTFGPVEEVPLAHEKDGSVYGWRIAMGPNGDVVAVWPSWGISIASRPVGRGWRTVAHDPDEPPPPDGSPAVGFDGRGTAIVAYVNKSYSLDERGRQRSHPARLMARRRAPGGKAFGPPQQVAQAKNIFTPRIAGDVLGNVIVVWSHEEIGSWDRDRTEEGIGSAIWDAREPSISAFDVDEQASEFEYRLSEAASVALTVERAGRSPKRLARLKFRARRGAGSRPIEEPLAKRLRGSGTYRATLVARDSAGRRSKTRRLTFGPLR
jgi:hypothetical protein